MSCAEIGDVLCKMLALSAPDPWSCCDGRSIEHKSAKTWDQQQRWAGEYSRMLIFKKLQCWSGPEIFVQASREGAGRKQVVEDFGSLLNVATA